MWCFAANAGCSRGAVERGGGARWRVSRGGEVAAAGGATGRGRGANEGATIGSSV